MNDASTMSEPTCSWCERLCAETTPRRNRGKRSVVMNEVSPDELKCAVESQHGGTATLAQSVWVDEQFEGKPVWQGVVHVFDLAGHPDAKRAYAWSSHTIDGSTKRRFIAVLHMGPITGPVEAVRAATEQEGFKAIKGMVTIRPAVLGDYEDLCELWKILDEHHRLALPNLFRQPAGARRERSYVQTVIEGPDSVIMVAEAEDKQLLGFAMIFVRMQAETPTRAERRYAEVDDMVVRPAVRRAGLGRALIKATAEWSEERGLKTLELAVHDFNEGALSFYRSLGFSTVLRRLARPSQSSN